LSGYALFPGKDKKDQLSLIHNYFGLKCKEDNALPTLQSDKLKLMLPSVNAEVCDLIQKLISFNPHDRPDAYQALHHSIFSKIRKAEEFYRKNREAIPFPIFYKHHFDKIEKSQLPMICQRKNQTVCHKRLNKGGNYHLPLNLPNILTSNLPKPRLVTPNISTQNQKLKKEMRNIVHPLIPKYVIKYSRN
jgi:serine/threonine protein kinase